MTDVDIYIDRHGLNEVIKKEMCGLKSNNNRLVFGDISQLSLTQWIESYREWCGVRQ